MPAYLDHLHRFFSNNAPTRAAFDRTPEDPLRQANVRQNFQGQVFSSQPLTVLFSPLLCETHGDGESTFTPRFLHANLFETEGLTSIARAIFDSPRYRAQAFDPAWFCVMRPEQIATLDITLPPYCEVFWTNVSSKLWVKGSLQDLKKALEEHQQDLRNTYAYIDEAIHRIQTKDVPADMFNPPHTFPPNWNPFSAENGVNDLLSRTPNQPPTIVTTPYTRWATLQEIEEERRRTEQETRIVQRGEPIPVYNPPRRQPSTVRRDAAIRVNRQRQPATSNVTTPNDETNAQHHRAASDTTIKANIVVPSIPAPTRANLSAQSKSREEGTAEVAPESTHRILSSEEVQAIKRWREDCEQRKLQLAPSTALNSSTSPFSNLFGASSLKKLGDASTAAPAPAANVEISGEAQRGPADARLAPRNERKRAATGTLPLERDTQESTRDESKGFRRPFRAFRWFAGSKNVSAHQAPATSETSKAVADKSSSSKATTTSPFTRTTINTPSSASTKLQPFVFNPQASPFVPIANSSTPLVAAPQAQPLTVMAFAAHVASPEGSPASSHSSMPGLVPISDDEEELPPPLIPRHAERLQTLERHLDILTRTDNDRMELDDRANDPFRYEYVPPAQSTSPGVIARPDAQRAEGPSSTVACEGSVPDIEDLATDRAFNHRRRNDPRPSSFQRKRLRDEKVKGRLDPLERAKGKQRLMPQLVKENPYVYLRSKYGPCETNDRKSRITEAGSSSVRPGTPFPTQPVPSSSKVKDPRVPKSKEPKDKN
ncbi:hypothetical protein SCHPADRAFT_889839 [Schizopora paradoxa]|uniref:Uncharacterized protein n=1 Tax=Schizopora paradoxa TaxID=27342 RepID=A0A0H2RW06_9AGAM|nr:hypothetical protein SCHPADRAFT_889839 [Schizopora paradoxa]